MESPTWLVPQWPVPATVRAISTLRGGGASRAEYASLNLAAHVGDEAAVVAENRRRLRIAAGLPTEPCWLRQVHGTLVANLDAGADSGANANSDANANSEAPTATGRGGAPVADASLTRRTGVVAAILTADCLPVLFACESGSAVAAAHAGWRGLAAGVLEATIEALGLAPAGLLAWIGPGIGPRHFEVGPEVREQLLAADPGAERAFALNERGRFLADLPALARRRLLGAGVKRLYGGGECTYADPVNYFSHRRDGTTGRQATLIWLERP